MESYRSRSQRSAASALATQWVYLPDKLGFVPSFEGIRGLAILLVLYHHAGSFNSFSCSVGRSGVAIFFTLSGFLITGVLKCLYAESPSFGFALRRFYVDRFMRLSPPILLACIYGVWMSSSHGEEPKRLGVWATRILTYTVNIEYQWLQKLLPYGPRKTEIWFDHLWSLCVEEQFYIFWSLALAAFLRFKLRTWVLWVTLAYFQYAAWRIAYSPSPFFNWHPKFSLGSALFKMLLGCLLRLSPMPKQLLTWYIGGSLAFFLFGMAYLLALQTQIKETEPFVTAICAYATAAWIPSLVTSGNWLLETRILRFIGRVSYSLYVYHIIQQTFDNTRFAHFRAWETIAFAFIFATFSTIFVEEPLCRAYKKWSRRNDAAHQSTANNAVEAQHCYISIPTEESHDMSHTTAALPSAQSALSLVNQHDEKQ